MPSIPRHLLAFSGLLAAYSIWDWFDHVSREGSQFAQHPVAWAAFTIASTVTLIAVLLGGHVGARRLGVGPHFLVDAGLLATAISVHLFASGPLWGRVFFSVGGPPMTFKPLAALILMVPLVAVLGVVRLVLPPRTPKIPGSEAVAA